MSLAVILTVFVACLAAAANGRSPTMKFRQLAMCRRFCTKEYLPVCGHNGAEERTFANRCMMKLHNCLNADKFHVRHDGECPTPNCVEACTMEYRPVCAWDGDVYQTFSNLCMMDSANCRATDDGSQIAFTFITYGECHYEDKVLVINY